MFNFQIVDCRTLETFQNAQIFVQQGSFLGEAHNKPVNNPWDVGLSLPVLPLLKHKSSTNVDILTMAKRIGKKHGDYTYL